MPRFQSDPSKTTFGIPIMQKGIYRLEFGEPKPFAAKDDKGEYKNWGVRYSTKVINSEDHPEVIGKPFGIINLYDHSEGAQSYSKQVEAAVLGVETDEEFNAEFGNEDWSYNTDDGTVGSGYHLLKGKVVDVMCGEPKPGKNKDGSENDKLQTNIEKWIIAK